MRTYKETLQLRKRAGDYVTQVGKQDSLNIVTPAITPVQSSRKAGKAIVKTTFASPVNKRNDNLPKPFIPSA